MTRPLGPPTQALTGVWTANVRSSRATAAGPLSISIVTASGEIRSHRAYRQVCRGTKTGRDSANSRCKRDCKPFGLVRRVDKPHICPLHAQITANCCDRSQRRAWTRSSSVVGSTAATPAIHGQVLGPVGGGWLIPDSPASSCCQLDWAVPPKTVSWRQFPSRPPHR